ncbi:phthalate transporter [Aspergillus sp. HF37]|nr:phthalate transporter [Aspergillus sp. HF37]
MSQTNSEKKTSLDRIEDVDQSALAHEDYDEVYSRPEQRKIIHRIDRRLVTMTGLAYCVSLMDRTNLSAAAIAGLREELNLNVGSRYSIVALIFFVPYVVFQPFMTVLTRKLGPTLFLGCIITCWGGIMIGMGFVKNWKQLVGTRFLLGLLEAGYFPGCLYLLSSWYSRFDVQKRFSIFYLIGCVASAFSGILAYGLMQLRGTHGLRGWSWIFILEGVITGVIGLLMFAFLIDFPDKAHKSWRFLNKDECNFIIRRINRDRSDGDAEKFTLKRFLKPALDLKIWAFAMIFFCLTTVTYAIAYFLPIILHENLGFSIGESQCLVAPPYGLAGIVMFGTAWVGDRYRKRGDNAVRYLGVFFTVAGANANIPSCMAYQANNVRGQWSRALSSATLVGFGGIGGIASSLVFREQDAPLYRPGIWTAIACNILIIIIVGCLSLWFHYCNKQADRGERVIEESPEFRYTI